MLQRSLSGRTTKGVNSSVCQQVDRPPNSRAVNCWNCCAEVAILRSESHHPREPHLARRCSYRLRQYFDQLDDDAIGISQIASLQTLHRTIIDQCDLAL